MNRFCLAALLTALISTTAAAHDIWITPGHVSYHANRGAHFNEGNYGLGVEVSIDEDSSVAVGEYRNSVRRQTNYALYNWRPLHYGIASLGVSVGLADGYQSVNKGKPFPAVLPTINLEYGWGGANLYYVPTVVGAHITGGALALQVKFNLGNYF